MMLPSNPHLKSTLSITLTNTCGSTPDVSQGPNNLVLRNINTTDELEHHYPSNRLES